jgi:hypothetical protein
MQLVGKVLKYCKEEISLAMHSEGFWGWMVAQWERSRYQVNTSCQILHEE